MSDQSGDNPNMTEEEYKELLAEQNREAQARQLELFNLFNSDDEE